MMWMQFKSLRLTSAALVLFAALGFSSTAMAHHTDDDGSEEIDAAFAHHTDDDGGEEVSDELAHHTDDDGSEELA
ncbi:hypothetical protein [Lujinxingia litoralis]|nr:hypothetical protein [Lujinxingia litoralis]